MNACDALSLHDTSLIIRELFGGRGVHIRGVGATVLLSYLRVYTVVPPLIRPPYLARSCGHIREVAFGENEK